MMLEELCLSLLFAVFSVNLTTAQLGQDRQGAHDISTENVTHGSLNFYYQIPEYPRDCKDVAQRCDSTLPLSGVYVIKPDGLINPFEVYCDFDSYGWTVIMRRVKGFLDFNRKWEDYKSGFGFPHGEFWLGTERLAYMSNQGASILRIDVVLANGSLFYVEYDEFRISDEWSNFTLLSVGMYFGNTNLPISNCPSGMIYGACSCQLSCDDPRLTKDCDPCAETEMCICRDGLFKKGNICVPPQECGCFSLETKSVIANDGSFVDVECSKLCICHDDHLTCYTNYECSSATQCRVPDGERQCICDEGHQGVGETCHPEWFTDCYDVFVAGHTVNGVYPILPNNWPGSPFNVYCDMTTSSGGWTVFLRRVDGVTNFYRNWTSYRNGFGSYNQNRDFWLGNEKLYYLTKQTNYKLRADITTPGGSELYEEYSSFRIGNESTAYVFYDPGTNTGTAGNGMALAAGHPFSTFDRDDDGCVDRDCPTGHKGGWWYSDTNSWCTIRQGTYCANFRDSTGWYARCTLSNLNGQWSGANGENIFWARDTYNYGHSYCRLSFAEMKIRPL